LLKSGKLVVEIDDPAASTHNRFNRSARRFSPVAMVLRAQFDGKDFFYSPIDGGAYGWAGGAPMEFDLGENVMNKPPGFSEAVASATNGSGDFLKIGVGILRKDTAGYNWGHNCTAVELAETQATWDTGGDQVTFRQTLKGVANGYAYELEETLQVHDHQMIMQYRLKNTGRKSFATEQYLHNFLVFSDQPVGPDYEVHLPYSFQLEGNPGPAIRRTPGRDVLEFWKGLPAGVKFRLTTPPGYSGRLRSRRLWTRRPEQKGRSLSRTGSLSAPSSRFHPLSASRETQRGATLNTPDPCCAWATNQRPACWMSPALSVFVSRASVWTGPDSARGFTAFCWINPIMANTRTRSVSSDAASAISPETASTCLASGSSPFVTA